MAVTLNHTVVVVKDAEESANFVAEILGCEIKHFGPFVQLQAANGVTLDFMTLMGDHEVHPAHYAFLVSDEDFEGIFSRITERKLPIWADPMKAVSGIPNDFDGGRGVYFEDPSGHYFEAYTRPYSSGGTGPEDIMEFVKTHGGQMKSAVGDLE